jgi:hypothetical protein
MLSSRAPREFSGRRCDALLQWRAAEFSRGLFSVFRSFFILLLWIAPFARAERDLYLDPYRLADQTAERLLDQNVKPGSARGIPISDFTKTLSIANGFTPRYSPERVQLMEWIASRPDGSISPADLMERASQVAGKDGLKAMVLCWDVLREGWNRMPRRNTLEHTLKLMDLTGEQEHFNGNFVEAEAKQPWLRKVLGRPIRSESIIGDNFSAWYHFFGTALNAYVIGLKSTPGLGQAQTQLLVTVQETLAGNRFFENQKRIYLDRAGARFGAQLLRNLRDEARFRARTHSQPKDLPFLYVKWLLLRPHPRRLPRYDDAADLPAPCFAR